jgi:hypothetical protein
MNIVAFFKKIKTNAANPATYETLIMLVAGMIMSTFVGEYLTKSFGVHNMAEYITCAVVTTVVLFAVNFAIFYIRLAKRLNCGISMATVAFASLGPTVPGILRLLRLFMRVPGIGMLMSLLLDRVFVRILVGIWPSVIYGTLSLLMFSCSAHT